MPLAEVTIPVLDRGFLFGDAVYEVLRIYGGKPWQLRQHLDRLGHSLSAIRIQDVDRRRLEERLLQTIAAGPFQEAVAYIQVTRGSSPTRSHAFPAQATPLELLWVAEFDDPYIEARRTGAKVITVPDIR